jgi:hypothetical protein
MDRENIEEILNKLGSEGVPAEICKIAEDASRNFNDNLTGFKHQIRWNNIMKIKITKLVAVAVILIGLSLVSWFSLQGSSSNGTQIMSGFSFLSKVCAAEQALFYQNGIVHISNEIVVHPRPQEPSYLSKIDELDINADMRKYLKTTSSWLDFNWLPICSLQADGEFRYNMLNLAKDIEETYTINDQAWFDPSTGRFVRIMKIGEEVLFGNSYDGQYVHSFEVDTNGRMQLISEPVSEDFEPPANPAEFLGITAGLQNTIGQEELQIPVQEVTQGSLEDGSEVNVYKIGYADLLGDINTYWLFKVAQDDSIVAEMEFVLAGSSQIVIRRVSSDSVDDVDICWDLAGMELANERTAEKPIATVETDTMLADVSVEHMIDRADFETYILGATPSWTEEGQICDIEDFTNSQHRMFSIVYPAKDGRHIISCQSYTFNNFFSWVLKYGRELYTSGNGCKLWAGGSAEKQWTEIHMTICGFTAAEDRKGYVIQTPGGTYLSLAINGQLSDEELHGLVDSVVSAREYQEMMNGEIDE